MVGAIAWGMIAAFVSYSFFKFWALLDVHFGCVYCSVSLWCAAFWSCQPCTSLLAKRVPSCHRLGWCTFVFSEMPHSRLTEQAGSIRAFSLSLLALLPDFWSESPHSLASGWVRHLVGPEPCIGAALIFYGLHDW